jgi:hypothetical protein
MTWNPITWVAGLLGWMHTAVCALTTDDGRKGWAMLAALGCSVTMTAYAAAVLFIVKDKPMLAFWLGLSALGIILLVVTGLMVLLGIKRNIEIQGDKDGGKVTISDTGGSSATNNDIAGGKAS